MASICFYRNINTCIRSHYRYSLDPKGLKEVLSPEPHVPHLLESWDSSMEPQPHGYSQAIGADSLLGLVFIQFLGCKDEPSLLI